MIAVLMHIGLLRLWFVSNIIKNRSFFISSEYNEHVNSVVSYWAKVPRQIKKKEIKHKKHFKIWLFIIFLFLIIINSYYISKILTTQESVVEKTQKIGMAKLITLS